jgi:hypothetical protein
MCSQQCPQSIACLPFSQKIEQQGLKKQLKKTKKKRITLNPSLRFGSPNHVL